MTTYAQQTAGDDLSTIVATDDQQDEAIRSFERGSTEPTIKPTGLIWACTNGTILSGLGAGSAAGHSVRYEQAVLTSGANAFGADQSMGSHKLTNLAAPTSANDAARKADVDAVSALLGIKSGEVSVSSDTTWEVVNLGYDFSAVLITIEATGRTQVAESVGVDGDYYAWPAFIRLAADGTGAVTLKYGEGDTLGAPFHALEFQRLEGGTKGFQVRRKGSVSSTITVRWIAVKNSA